MALENTKNINDIEKAKFLIEKTKYRGTQLIKKLELLPESSETKEEKELLKTMESKLTILLLDIAGKKRQLIEYPLAKFENKDSAIVEDFSMVIDFLEEHHDIINEEKNLLKLREAIKHNGSQSQLLVANNCLSLLDYKEKMQKSRATDKDWAKNRKRFLELQKKKLVLFPYIRVLQKNLQKTVFQN